MQSIMRMRPMMRVATYFITLHLPSAPGRPGDGDIIATAKQAWTRALRSRYQLLPHQDPDILRLKPEQFDIGFHAATHIVSTSRDR
jgi:hypothetical protein